MRIGECAMGIATVVRHLSACLIRTYSESQRHLERGVRLGHHREGNNERIS